MIKNKGNSVVFTTSPLVFFTRLLWGELAIGIIFVSFNVTRTTTSIISDRYPALDQLLTDTITLIIFLSLELFLILFLFLTWYTERYEITPETIQFSRFGMRRRPIIPLNLISEAQVVTNTLQQMLHTGSVQLQGSKNQTVTIKNLAEPDEFLAVMQMVKDQQNTRITVPEKLLQANAKELIKSTESQYVEFKSSLIFDYRQKRANSDLIKPVLKTVTAFLNSTGGILLIGVDDKGKILGLDADFGTLTKGSVDAWENALTTYIHKHIGLEFYQYLSISFETVQKKSIAIVRVDPSPMPAYLNFQGKEEFYVRTGNSSQPLSVAKATTYIQTHFKKDA